MVPNHYQRKFAAIPNTAATAVTVVAAVTGKSILVLHWFVCATDKGSTVQWMSDDGSLCGDGIVLASGASASASCDDGCFMTVQSEPLVAGNSASAKLGGYVVYIEY